MCRLLETIQCFDGSLENLEYHQQRLNRSVFELFGNQTTISLQNEIKVPEFAKKGVFRCRIIYGKSIEKTEFHPYHPREIKSLKLLEDNQIDYHLKFHARKNLELLFEKRETCDDIIIVKKGFITDSFAANLVFYDGKNWFTPDTPLLRGTQRQSVIDSGVITECKIGIDDLHRFQKVGLINALNSIEDMPVVEMKNVVF